MLTERKEWGPRQRKQFTLLPSAFPVLRRGAGGRDRHSPRGPSSKGPRAQPSPTVTASGELHSFPADTFFKGKCMPTCMLSHFSRV